MATQISKNFNLEELCYSATAKAKGIKNEPNQEQVANLRALVHNVLQPLRDRYGKEVKIASGFRCKSLNAVVGGVSNSQHMTGQAADLCIDGNMDKGRAFIDIIRLYCDFDQLIWEHNAKGAYWVHVSYMNDGKNRRQYIPDLLKR